MGQAERVHRARLVGVIAGVVLASPRSSVPLTAVFGFFLMGIGLGGVNTLMWALEADTVEYGEWKTGIRTEGTTYALFSFTRKMGQAIGGAAGAYALGIVAFNSQWAKDGTRRRPRPSRASSFPLVASWLGSSCCRW